MPCRPSPGLPRGITGGEDPAPLPLEQQTAQALQAINPARSRAGVAPLQANPGLTQAARALLPRGDPTPGRLAPSGNLLDAIPADQRSRWQSVAVLTGACGGCSVAPTATDLRYFRETWLDDPQYRQTLLDPRSTHLGFAMAANGDGAKTVLVMLGVGLGTGR